jgi:hypothetical protein
MLAISFSDISLYLKGIGTDLGLSGPAATAAVTVFILFRPSCSAGKKVELPLDLSLGGLNSFVDKFGNKVV